MPTRHYLPKTLQRLLVQMTSLVMALGFTMLFFTLHMMAMRNEIWRRRVSAMQRIEARRAERQGV